MRWTNLKAAVNQSKKLLKSTIIIEMQTLMNFDKIILKVKIRQAMLSNKAKIITIGEDIVLKNKHPFEEIIQKIIVHLQTIREITKVLIKDIINFQYIFNVKAILQMPYKDILKIDQQATISEQGKVDHQESSSDHTKCIHFIMQIIENNTTITTMMAT